jgi:hypothetical protein
MLGEVFFTSPSLGVKFFFTTSTVKNWIHVFNVGKGESRFSGTSPVEKLG